MGRWPTFLAPESARVAVVRLSSSQCVVARLALVGRSSRPRFNDPICSNFFHFLLPDLSFSDVTLIFQHFEKRSFDLFRPTTEQNETTRADPLAHKTGRVAVLCTLAASQRNHREAPKRSRPQQPLIASANEQSERLWLPFTQRVGLSIQAIYYYWNHIHPRRSLLGDT